MDRGKMIYTELNGIRDGKSYGVFTDICTGDCGTGSPTRTDGSIKRTGQNGRLMAA